MANELQLREGLSTWFGSAVTTDDGVMNECLQICSNYNITPDSLFFNWEAFSFNSVASIQIMNLDGAKALRAHVAREFARTNEKSTSNAKGNAKGRAKVPTLAVGSRLGANVALRANVSATRSIPPVNLSVKFEGPDAKEMSKRKYRYMFEKISTRSEALDDRIDEFNQVVREKYDVDEFGDPSSVSEDVVTVLGRICLDSETDAVASSSKLSSTTLVLEPSRMGGSGERVPIKFAPDFCIRGATDSNAGKSLFPGEIVALRGRNGGGGWFLVTEILPLPPVAPSPKLTQGALSISVASGPYTSDQTLNFSPFNAIIEEAKASSPSVLILLGPFIDAAHPAVKSGKLPSSPLSLFQQSFTHPMQSLLQQNPDTLILIVPHVRDILCSHTVFPQGCGESDFGILPSSIRILPNPCIISLNGVRLGISTMDVLYHLKNQQYIQRPMQVSNGIATQPAPSDAMANLCRHVLEQRSFYPVFPVPLELSSDVNLDVSHSEHLKLGESAPDVLLLPSILRQFSKIVENTIVVNPSVFAKSRTLAILQIPAAIEMNKICDIANVELKRLG
ncbi:DNA polymerase alpha/epsilon subunit B-domain-containing protein [Hysterangium stoloniferum]|nr:DNA polymerase alpha/epsilon subunit B-domain-containing protein [Hysterangium stoloniferum]